MRTHRKYQQLLMWREPSLLREVAQLRHLVSARIEPLIRGGALLDLVCCDGERVAVIPCVELDTAMLMEIEMSAFIWPHEPARILGDGAVSEFERALGPWIESLTLARQLNEETIRAFGDRDADALVSTAREAGLVGAASYTRVFEDLAPYVYAARFAQNGKVAVRDARGGSGTALLAACAREVQADFETDGRRALVERWLGRTLSAIEPDIIFDVAVYRHDSARIDARSRIVLDAPRGEGAYLEVSTPIPMDLTVSFEGGSPACRGFAAHHAQPTLRPTFVPAAPAASGGSSGRIVMVLRNDYNRAPDSDTDEAQAMAQLLRAEGFAVDIAAASAALPAGYDLVHAFTLARVDELGPVLESAHASGTPIVLSPLLHDVSAQGSWGTGIVRSVLRLDIDETDLEDNLRLIASRRLEGPGLSSKRQEPFAGYDAAVRRALQLAGAVLARPGEEETLLRSFGYLGEIVPSSPCVFATRTPASDAPPVAGDFILAHVPLEARSNLLLLVRAAASARLPLVVAGSITEPDFTATVRDQAGDQVIFLPEPDAATAQTLYRSARVYADVSWVRFGAHRLIRAAACGAVLVTAQDAGVRDVIGPEAVWEADIASQESIALALADAWMHASPQAPAMLAAARRAGALGDPGTALTATARAYAAASRPSAAPA